MSIFENEVHCVLSYVVIILPAVPRLLGCFPVSDVGFFIAMIECFFLTLVPFTLRHIISVNNCKCVCSFLF